MRWSSLLSGAAEAGYAKKSSSLALFSADAQHAELKAIEDRSRSGTSIASRSWASGVFSTDAWVVGWDRTLTVLMKLVGLLVERLAGCARQGPVRTTAQRQSRAAQCSAGQVCCQPEDGPYNTLRPTSLQMSFSAVDQDYCPDGEVSVIHSDSSMMIRERTHSESPTLHVWNGVGSLPRARMQCHLPVQHNATRTPSIQGTSAM